MKTIRCNLLSALLSAVFSVSAYAAPTVTFSLYPNQSGPNTFNLYASASLGDNAGIAFYGIPLLNISSVDHKSPIANALFAGPPFFSTLGFNLLRSADNAATVLASQDTINASSPLIYGMGQTSGNLAAYPGVTSLLPGSEQPAYSAPLLIASGTYSGALPAFNLNSVDLVANVFVSNTSRQVIAADVRAVVVPEAESVAMVGIACLCVIGYSVRRRFSH